MARSLSQRWVEKTEYKHAPDSKKQHIVQDSKIPELHIRFYPSGRKTWVLRYYLPDEQRRRQMTLGKFPAFDLQSARDEARKKLAEVAHGGDPLGEQEADKKTETFAELAAKFIEEDARRYRATWAEDQQRLERHVLGRDGEEPPTDWATRKVENLDYHDVDKLHRGLSDTPFEANRVLSLLHLVFEFAKKKRIIPRDALNPAADVDPFEEPSRDRVVERDEMPALWAAIEEEGNPHLVALLKLLILTGQRKTELMRARWEHVDFDARHLVIPKRKNSESRRGSKKSKKSKAHVVPLADPAVAVLRALPRLTHNPYVFVGRNDGEPLKSINRSWHRKAVIHPETGVIMSSMAEAEREGVVPRIELHGIRNRAGLEGLRIHDLRHTAGWWIANELGYSELVVRGFLGHAIPGITGTYVDATTRRVPKEVRNAADEYAADIMATVGELGDNVVSIHGGAGE